MCRSLSVLQWSVTALGSFQVNYNDSVTGQEEDAWNNDMSDFDTDFSGECECPYCVSMPLGSAVTNSGAAVH